MKKTVSLIVVLLVLLAMIAGCTSPETTTTGTDGQTTTQTNGTTEPSDPIHLTFQLRDEGLLDHVDNHYFLERAKEHFNITVDFIIRPPGGEVVEWWTLQALAGDAPDYGLDLSFNFAAVSDFVRDDLLAKVPVDEISQLAPTYIEWLDEHSWVWSGNPWEFYKIAGDDYVMPLSVWWISRMMYVGIRGDWMENVGITKIPETLDEFEELLHRFTFDDPNRSGLDDTYGYLGIQSDPFWAFNPIYGAFDCYPGLFRATEDGTVVRGEVQPAMKDALRLIRSWIEKGYVDPEWITTGFEQAAEKMNSSIAGVSWQNIDVFLHPESAWFWTALRENEPDSYYVLSPGPKGPGGKQGMMQFNPANGVGVFFAKHLEQEPEKLTKYIQVIGTTHTDVEWMELYYRGIEGVHYEKDTSGEDVFYEWIAPYDDSIQRRDAGVGILALPPEELFQSLDTDLVLRATDREFWNQKKYYLENAQGQFDILAPFPKPVWERNSSTLNDLSIAFFNDVLTGVRPVDDFDAYVDEWMSMGGQEALEEAQRIYDTRFR